MHNFRKHHRRQRQHQPQQAARHGPRRYIRFHRIRTEISLCKHRVRSKHELARAKTPNQRQHLPQQTFYIKRFRPQRPQIARPPDGNHRRHPDSNERARHHARRAETQRQHKQRRDSQTSHAAENGRPAQPEKILTPLQHPAEQRHPQRNQQQRQRHQQTRRARQLPTLDNGSPKQKKHQRAQRPDDERPQPHQPDHSRQLPLPAVRQRQRRLLREHHLQRHRRQARHHHQQRNERSVFRVGDVFVERMHSQRHRPAHNVRNHQPAALPEKRRVRLVVNRRYRFSFFNSHKFSKKSFACFVSLRFQPVQGSDLKNLTSKSFPRSSSAIEIHSSAVCACAMSPGPNTTLGMPPRDNTAASQKKSTPARRAWPTLRKKSRTNGSFGLVSSGRHGASFVLKIFAGSFFARSNAAISRRTLVSVSPGSVRRSIVIAQRSGTMFGWVPPQIVPTFTVAVPSSGCRRFRNRAA